MRCIIRHTRSLKPSKSFSKTRFTEKKPENLHATLDSQVKGKDWTDGPEKDNKTKPKQKQKQATQQTKQNKQQNKQQHKKKEENNTKRHHNSAKKVPAQKIPQKIKNGNQKNDKNK